MRTSQNTKQPGKKKGPRLFVTYMQEKLAVTVLVITLALFSLVMVLYNIVKTKQGDYNQIVLSQQDYNSRPIPYRRGDIVDRNGTFLATSEKVYNIILDPKQIMSAPERYLEPTVQALNQVFGYDAGEIRDLIQRNGDTAYIRYDRRLSNDKKLEFEELKTQMNEAYSEEDSKERVKGIWFEDEYRRVYPYSSLACHVIGFSQSDSSRGSGGIEQYYNDKLIGVNGREYGYLNEETNLERVIKPASNGNTIVSTIDLNVQKIVEKYIDQWENTTGSNMSAAIVMNPNNGEILAMANKNRFDLNNPRDLGGRFTDEEIRQFGVQEAMDDYHRKNPDQPKLTEDQVSQHYSDEDVVSLGTQVAWNKIWRNFGVSDTYEPGSTQKIFTIAAGLEEGILTGNETFFCDGYQQVGKWPIRCVKRTGHGMQTIPETLMNSCNDAMMQMVAMYGKERFMKYQKLFGFGSKTGVDLPGEADTSTLIYDVDDMGAADLATNSFGQNYNCTMIQMAAAYCSVINGGSYYEPHVVKQILNEQGSVVKKIEPNLVRETVSESTANYLKDALFRTVAEGTGKAAQVAGYKVGGKTGTAEKLPRSAKNYVVSFAGFAPVDDPQLFVYVVIDTPHLPSSEQPHSTFASNIVQQILTDALPYMNVFPDTELPEVSEELEGQLPEEEGISSGGELVPGGTETEAETKVYETDEYVEPDGQDSGIPDLVPGVEEGEADPDNMEWESGSGAAAPTIEDGRNSPSSQAAEASSETGKPAKTQPAETRPAETQTAGTRPAETQTAGTKPAETQTAGTKPAETRPAETTGHAAETTGTQEAGPGIRRPASPEGTGSPGEGPQSPAPSGADVTVPARE